jgi:hypothetical protein
LVDNPMLQAWCGAHPCEWMTIGDTQRVGTWHPDDYAIELVGDDSGVTQLNADVNQEKSSCFAFSLTADIGADTKVYLTLDFLDDGVPEFEALLPELHWERKTFDITPPTWYKGVRFIVRKEGAGHAIVAQLDVANKRSGCFAPAIALGNRPAGARCMSDDECEMQQCANAICR